MHNIKIVHTADLHLGSTFSNMPYSNAVIRQNEAIHTALKIINGALDADILLIAGDIFDTEEISRSVLDTLLGAIASLKKTRVFYSCGNHDSYYTPAVEYCRNNAPANFHIFPPDEVSFVTLEDIHARVYGCSYSSQHSDGTMLNDINPCDNSFINILCTHSDMADSAYNPCDLKLLSKLGFDYVALGHIHSYSGIKKVGNLLWAYPGIPEPTGFDECGEKGYIKGDISKHGNSLEFIPCQKRKYIDETVDITDFISEHELIDVLESMTESQDNICRFTLVGENKFPSSVNTDIIADSLHCFCAECIDNSRVPLSPEDCANLPGLKGVCAQKTISMLSDAHTDKEKNLIKKAFAILSECFETR